MVTAVRIVLHLEKCRENEERIVYLFTKRAISPSLRGDAISSFFHVTVTRTINVDLSFEKIRPLSLFFSRRPLDRFIVTVPVIAKHLPYHSMTQNHLEFAKHSGLLTRLPIRTRRFLGLSVRLLTLSLISLPLENGGRVKNA